MEEILIADSGATKTDWCVAKNGEILFRFTGKGISPVYQSEDEITEEIQKNVYPLLKNRPIDAVYFYGSGCIPEKTAVVRNAIYQSLPVETIEVYSDLVGAAHALCGHEAGIACILGTGSNSCEWDGETIVKHIPPLGFILGDEGSGAVFGKLLVSDALKNRLSPGLKEKLLEQYGLSQAIIIDRVYKQPFPSRFLASFSPFILENIEDPTIRRIVDTNFSDFFERNVMQYHYRENKVNFVGSIAFHYADYLKETADSKGIRIGTIYASPMEGLVGYYALH
ncbi:ATPase [Anaerorudis cellulosivorans]|uniref:ATPase n=1 Tax=Anaerorudis cellulosivorans TaxID=3397862 RepID=UPI00221F15B1|nr:ATPase [Seramator thermalis]MCW1734332.1 ATPase [Seramator thermalis]